MNNEENSTPQLVLASPASVPPFRKSFLDTSVNATRLVWNLLLIAGGITVAGVCAVNLAPAKQPEGLNDFIGMASPVETVPQHFSIGNHKMPSVAVLAPVPEAERVANPSFTAVQLQRAKWMDRTWQAVRARNEAETAVNKNGKGFAVEFVQSVLAKDSKDGGSVARAVMSGKDIAELSAINVIAGAELVPALASGQLPVFSDAETALWKVEVARQKLRLSELDMRRAKFYQAKVGARSVPPKSPEDVEIRAEEKLFNDAQPSMFGMRQSGQAAPLSDNERLELACGVLNEVANQTARPVAVAPVAAAHL